MPLFFRYYVPWNRSIPLSKILKRDSILPKKSPIWWEKDVVMNRVPWNEKENPLNAPPKVRVRIINQLNCSHLVCGLPPAALSAWPATQHLIRPRRASARHWSHPRRRGFAKEGWNGCGRGRWESRAYRLEWRRDGEGRGREVKSLVKAGSQVDERGFGGLLCLSKLEDTAAKVTGLVKGLNWKRKSRASIVRLCHPLATKLGDLSLFDCCLVQLHSTPPDSPSLKGRLQSMRFSWTIQKKTACQVSSWVSRVSVRGPLRDRQAEGGESFNRGTVSTEVVVHIWFWSMLYWRSFTPPFQIVVTWSRKKPRPEVLTNRKPWGFPQRWKKKIPDIHMSIFIDFRQFPLSTC